MAKYFLIAGEASGDLHAAALIAQLKQQDPDAQFVGLINQKTREKLVNRFKM